MINRRPLSIGIAWLLALVLLRSLVPTGFMPAWVDGGFALVLCEDQGWVPAAAPGAHHQHHHGGGDAPSGHHAGGDCAYAQSAHPAMAAVVELPPAPAQMLFAGPPDIRSLAPHAQLPRYRAPRGPPTLV